MVTIVAFQAVDLGSITGQRKSTRKAFLAICSITVILLLSNFIQTENLNSVKKIFLQKKGET